MHYFRKTVWVRLLLTLVLAALLAACGPENGRARGGGPGADIGNKPANLLPQSKIYTSNDS
ncbi:MAG: hypothetical protein MI924_23115 [Chloroflexales bacterium]|nr:hypothetical protein [Chloroflexales bacterium]